MTLIAWRDEFSVGVESVDQEHREMIELINGLDSAMAQDADCITVISTLGEIYARISAHFALEEKFMRETRYPQFPEHKGDHESLLDQLRDIMDGVEDEGGYDEAELSAALSDWFTVHFRTHDALLHRHGH
jgi:hemerythrin